MDDANPDFDQTTTSGPTGTSANVPGPGPTQTVPPARPFVEKIFFGHDGLRSGWRMLIFLAVAAICIFAFGGLLAPLLRRQRIGPTRGFSPLTLSLGEGIPLAGVLIAAWVMAKIEHRTFADFGLSFRHFAFAKFWLGIFWGWLALTALLLGILLLHGFAFGSLAIHGQAAVRYAIFWAVAFLVVGLFEEFGFRGYLLSTLSTGIGFWPAAIVLSTIFGVIHLHNAGEDWVGGLAAALIGLFFCFTVRRLGTLWFAVGFHAAWDYAESFIYSVPDSGIAAQGHLMNSSFHGPNWLTGGSVGPEGSLLVFAVIGVAFILFDRIHRHAEFPLHLPRAT
ncbi:MAG TPA: type II CAAX endopeptidase family protein [Terriglobia bacterium]|nr:type II CAAX endopeptidase family protein [Terriglobia bacterium]